MDNFFIQLEVQVDAQGNKSVIPLVYDEQRDAEAKNYTVLSAAAKSNLPYHAGIIVRSDLIATDGRAYINEVEEG